VIARRSRCVFAGFLGLAGGRTVNVRMGSFGVDSLMALQIRTWFAKRLEVSGNGRWLTLANAEEKFGSKY